MKTWRNKIVALGLAAMMLCGSVIGVSASEEEFYNRIGVESVVVEDGYTLKLLNSAGNEVTKTTELVGEADAEVYKNVVKMKFSIDQPVAGQQYVVMLLSGGAEIPTSSNIRYIDQDTAGDGFTIYPDQISEVGTYSVIVSSADGKVTAAKFEVLEPPYVLGDVDEDGDITANDAGKVLRKVAKLEEFSNKQTMAADADKDGDITANDAGKILRVVAKLETLS